MDDAVVARTAEQRGDAFVLAGARKDLRAGHGKLDIGGGGFGSGGDFFGNANRVGGDGGAAPRRWPGLSPGAAPVQARRH